MIMKKYKTQYATECTVIQYIQYFKVNEIFCGLATINMTGGKR